MGLGEVAHAAVADGRALVRGLETGQNPQQCGFARAVFADDRHMFTGRDGNVDAGKELAVPIAVGYARKAEMFAQGVLAVGASLPDGGLRPQYGTGGRHSGTEALGTEAGAAVGRQ